MATFVRIDPERVQAWQYEGDGVFPEGAKGFLEREHAFHVNSEISASTRRVAALVGHPIPDNVTHNDYLYWAHEGNNRCAVGDWIVLDEDGQLSVWDDELFRQTFAPSTD